jgi:hypothetical protein
MRAGVWLIFLVDMSMKGTKHLLGDGLFAKGTVDELFAGGITTAVAVGTIKDDSMRGEALWYDGVCRLMLGGE